MLTVTFLSAYYILRTSVIKHIYIYTHIYIECVDTPIHFVLYLPSFFGPI